MNARPTLLLALASAALCARAVEPELLPGGRDTVELRVGERNPFGQATVPVLEQNEAPVTETEELRLRKILASIKVAGVSASGKKRSLLLGSLILREGDRLPPLIANQSEILSVSKISPEEAMLLFTESDKTAEPRQIIIPINVKPKVAGLLYGEAVQSLVPTGKNGRPSLDPINLESVETLLKEAKESDLEGITTRDFQMMGDQNAPEKTTRDQ